MALIYEKFVKTEFDENNRLCKLDFIPDETYNFGFDVMDALAEKTPEKRALLWLSKEKEMHNFTFSDLKKYSNQTANYFVSLGIKKGDRVMLVLKRHYQFWFSMLALDKIGAIAIPATDQLTCKDFIYRFDKAGVKAIVCTADGNVSDHAEEAMHASPSVTIKMIVNGTKEGWHSFDSDITNQSEVFDRPVGEACPMRDEIMLMYFTSGTTSYPKIAAHTHTYSLGHIVTAKFWHNVSPEGVHCTISDTGWGKAVWGKLYGQWLAETCVFAYDFVKFDAHDILPLFKEYQITTFCAPPTMFRFFIKEDLAKYDLSSLQYATVAGEALNPEVFNKFLEHTGVKLMEGFGQTETTLLIANLIGDTPKPGSMGKPNPQFDVMLIDSDDQQVPVGEVGEIVINVSEQTPCGLFKEYYNDPEKTAEAVRNGFYHTGDTAWMDEEGYYWYVGRTDDLIKSSGYRIGPFEIESVIMELPYVLECAVIGVPDPDETRGQLVKATIVLTKDKEASEELKKEIQTYVKNLTAPYKYPRIVEFAAELPKTISGKIRRVELREK